MQGGGRGDPWSSSSFLQYKYCLKTEQTLSSEHHKYGQSSDIKKRIRKLCTLYKKCGRVNIHF